MYAIEAKNLTKRYKEVLAVNGLSLCVEEGELFSLLGVNGAGKTTAIKMLSCLTRPTEGDALILGKSIRTEAAAVKSVIAVSPQETAVAPALSVREYLELIAGIHGFSREKTAEKIKELSALLGLEAVLARKAGKLSGGYQRRLSIAMALISEPKILFLDEGRFDATFAAHGFNALGTVTDEKRTVLHNGNTVGKSFCLLHIMRG